MPIPVRDCIAAIEEVREKISHINRIYNNYRTINEYA